LFSGNDNCPVCRSVILDTRDGALRDRYDAWGRLLERVTAFMCASLMWLTTVVVAPFTAVAYTFSTLYHLAWILIAGAMTSLLYCAFFALWFAWLLDWPLLQGSALCLHSRALLPNASLHVTLFEQELSDRILVAGDTGSWLLLMLLRQALLVGLNCLAQIAGSHVLCGAVT